MQLRHQGIQTIESLLIAQTLHKLYPQHLSVEVALKVENMHFNAALLTIVHRRAMANVEHPHP